MKIFYVWILKQFAKCTKLCRIVISINFIYLITVAQSLNAWQADIRDFCNSLN